MTDINLDELEALALAANDSLHSQVKFIEAATPETILKLIAVIREAEGALEHCDKVLVADQRSDPERCHNDVIKTLASIRELMGENNDQ